MSCMKLQKFRSQDVPEDLCWLQVEKKKKEKWQSKFVLYILNVMNEFNELVCGRDFRGENVK